MCCCCCFILIKQTDRWIRAMALAWMEYWNKKTLRLRCYNSGMYSCTYYLSIYYSHSIIYNVSCTELSSQRADFTVKSAYVFSSCKLECRTGIQESTWIVGVPGKRFMGLLKRVGLFGKLLVQNWETHDQEWQLYWENSDIIPVLQDKGNIRIPSTGISSEQGRWFLHFHKLWSVPSRNWIERYD